nr:hypothetical protein BaRGS_027278 [Batillaria attramentaria]
MQDPGESHVSFVAALPRSYSYDNDNNHDDYITDYDDTTRAWRVVLDAGFLKVCPIQPHFLRRICLATDSRQGALQTRHQARNSNSSDNNNSRNNSNKNNNDKKIRH